MITIDFQQAYISLVIPFAAIWVLLFCLGGREARKKQLFASFLAVPLGIISELLYCRDYWMPASILSFNWGVVVFRLEDFLFAFCIGGIAVAIFNFISKGRFGITDKKIYSASFLFGVIGLAVFVSLFLFFCGINSILTTSLGMVVATGLMIGKRKDLFRHSLFSGLGMALIMFISYFLLFNFFISNTEEMFKQGWLIYGTPLDIRIYNVPITEMLWGFCWGSVAGPFYNFLRRTRFLAPRHL